ncbi:MAG: DUF2797 domain-containing protein [Candidatus Aenigmarchaeota archaeon]|nr:DUF2797 domain-containing protein [Candidatus Aenigmarchaeota archaeon]
MQIMKYSWKQESGSYEPYISLSDGSSMKLFGRDIDMVLGKKTCTGYKKKGKHFKCPISSPTDSNYMCNYCRMEDDFFNCVQCTGKECINLPQRDSCMENRYFIYLASFGSILKVGISFNMRFLHRLIEQGADFGAKIGHVKDGKEVRMIEQDIRRHLGIVDRVVSMEKHSRLFCDPNVCIESISSAIARLGGNGFDAHLINPEIYDLRSHYRLDRIISEPDVVEVADGTRIKGTVTSAKGNIIAVKDGKRFSAINAHRLIGRHV